ncbi:MAG: hypothetical protein HKP38_09845 [Croceitalea sp.]|nr:fibronectin type III domain-containing protein [Croceitalea sp.]NNL09513.1 hypothetical protein [Croceitalea sp.]
MRGTPYTWKVTTILINSNDEVDSDTEAFYNAAATGEFAFVPFPSICIAPENNAQLSLESSSITLEWEASDLDDDILNYDVYFGATTSPLLYAEEVLDTQLQVSELIAGNRYYWQVVTRDAQGNESISEVFTFEVID